MSAESKSQENKADCFGPDRGAPREPRSLRLSEFGLQGAPNAPLASLEFQYQRLNQRQLS